MPENRRKTPRALLVERLEDRLTPSGVTESFDTTAIGQMPAGWAQWSGTGQPVFSVSGTRSLSPTHSLVANTPSDWIPAQAWLSAAQPSDVQVGAAIYLDNRPMPEHLVARGSGLNSATPTYYGVQFTPGFEAKIVRVQQGQITVLAWVDTVQTFQQAWVRVIFSLSGTSLRAQIVRPDTGQYLAANGHWQSASTWALQTTDGAITSGGQVGFARTPTYAGPLFFDDFSAIPLGDTQPPTVSLLTPAAGATVSGMVTAQAQASDNVAVARVEFYLDGALRATSTSAPYTWGFDSSALSNGTHTISARAYDLAGNAAQANVSVVASNATALPVPSLPQHYPWIRVAQLLYSPTQLDGFGQNLLTQSVDLVVTPGGSLGAQVSAAAPNTTQVIYTNLSTLYQNLLLDWLNYADANGISRESAFYHYSVETAYSGTSPSSQPVNWFWNVYRSGSSPADLTANSRGTTAGQYSAFGNQVGDAVYLGYPEKFREINLSLVLPPSGGWAAQLEYPTAVDANGNPTQWARVSRLGDDTNQAQGSGRVWFDPPADWKKISVNGSAPMYYVRYRTISAGIAPTARTILGRDYTASQGGNSGNVPAFDTSADRNGDGYLNDAEYANRKPGMNARFLYESRAVFGGYGEMRFATNPSNPAFRAWAMNWVARLVQNQPASVGVFMDNSEGDVPVPAGRTSESLATYQQDYASLLNAGSRLVAPRMFLSNTTSYPMIRQTTGAFAEFALRPLSATYEQFEGIAAWMAQAQALRSPQPYLVLDVLPENGSPTDPRMQMAALAYYYLLADPTYTFVDFFGGAETGSTWTRHWVPAAAYNVGQPQGTWSLFATGPDPENPTKTYRIYQRAYGNALVLYKPISLGNGYRGTIDDATATTHLLPGTYRQLNADGSLGPITTQVTLRNGEGAVLIKA